MRIDMEIEMSGYLHLPKKVFNQRFVKFGLVGVSGIPVNICMLFVGKEWLFRGVTSNFHGVDLRLNLALTVAILVSILNNFIWNRHWTWRDRKHESVEANILIEFLRYAMASWLGIGVQFFLTNFLIKIGVYYLIANLCAILVSSGFNFVLNDKWTFRKKVKN